MSHALRRVVTLVAASSRARCSRNPVLPIMPCESVGYEIGSTAIIKGTRNLDAVKKFVDWALSPEGNCVGLGVGEYAIATNRNVPLPPQVPKRTDVNVIRYDFARHGAADTRKHLLERWDREVSALPR